MTKCNATAELMDANMHVIPGVILTCELEAGHDHRTLSPPSLDPTPHAFTFRWADPTTDELAEVFDPDEDFDLEVDIAPADVIATQDSNAMALNDMAPIREARPCCSPCGGAIKSASLLNSICGCPHTEGIVKDHAAYQAMPVAADVDVDPLVDEHVD